MARPGPRAARTPGPVTIGDVANAAQVSRATVSRVMNGRSTVDPEIAARVRAAAARLQYQPSTLARSLSLGRTETVALVVPDLGNPMFQQVLQGVTTAAAEDGYRVLVADSQERAADEPDIALEARRRCDAVLLVSPRMPDEALAALLPRVGPAVLVNRRATGTTSLWVDYATGTAAVVEHLVALGHRDLVYLAGPAGSVSDTQRRRALDDAVRAHDGLTVTVLDGCSTVDDGYRCADAVLASRATAAVCYNDLVAFGLLARLNETGVAVPDDLSVVGCDDIELARYATPSLTTVAVSQTEVGHQAWLRLRRTIDGVVSGAGDDAVDVDGDVRVEPRLEVRASTGPAPRRPASSGAGSAPSRPDGVPAADGTGQAVPHATRSALAPQPSTAGDVAAWHPEVDAVALSAGDALLARYRDGHRMSAVHAPRPYLHPVHTLGGAPLSDMAPVDHRHHHGVSFAVPDVNGTTFWGGRTFVRELGPTLLPNHGTQTGDGARPDPRDASTLVDELTWRDPHGAPLLTEHRRLRARLLPAHDAWALSWDSTLRADGDLVLTSPVAHGRPGAGYGGIFWRLQATLRTEVLSAAGDGEASAHGSDAAWVAFAQERDGAWSTLVLTTREPGRRWFLRAASFPGAGPCLAWDEPLRVPAGGSFGADLLAVAVDRRLTATQAAELAEAGRESAG